uniref:Putative auto-transporter adhesin head GIN domain-containing protein n=1 Tax=Globisporangium ultimum (strain ATCC 200006 / CBS 805.95 / DAOM BR144) TaxID=431595 RepID=K3X9H8_GLOUD
MQAPVSSRGPHQTLEKTWTITSLSGLRNLLVQVPGAVFVDYDASLKSASDVVAKVVMTGDSADLLQLFQVNPWSQHEGDGIEFRFHNDANIRARGHVLAQIFVSDKHALQLVKSSSSADVVVGDSIVVNDNVDAKLEVESSGSGGIFITSTEAMTIRALTVTTSGSGDIQVQVPSVKASKAIEINSSGSGEVAILADEISSATVSTKVTGSAEVFLQANRVSATAINTIVAGSGSATFSRRGQCATHYIKVSGSGSVAAGSIVSENADVIVSGSGDVLVQATNKLVASISGSGSVQYVNAQPSQVLATGSHFRKNSKHSHKKIKQASKNRYDVYHPRELPPRTPQLIVLHNAGYVRWGDDHASWGNGWNIDDDSDSSEDFDYWRATSIKPAAALPPSVGDSSTVVILVLAGVVMGVAGVTLQRYRNRSTYNPLV